MKTVRAISQLRTTDLDASIHFYVERLGMRLAFRHEDFYAGIAASGEPDLPLFHLKRVDATDPSIADVEANEHFHLYFELDDAKAAAEELKARGVELLRDVHDTPWRTREFVLRDDQGHTLYFGQPL